MNKKIPPFISPAAVVSIVLALSATNLVVNKVTNTSEGAPNVSSNSSSLVVNRNSNGESNDYKASYSSERYINSSNVINHSSTQKNNIVRDNSSVVNNNNDQGNVNVKPVQKNDTNNVNSNNNVTN